MQDLVNAALDAIVLFLFLSGAVCFAVMTQGAFVMRRLARAKPHEDYPTLLKSRLVPAISVIATAPDASAAARASVRLLLGLHFGNHEVILALDGPSDADLTVWSEEFHLVNSLRPVIGTLPMEHVRSVLEPGDSVPLTVIVMKRGGRTLALNAAVNAARSPVIAYFGAECEFEPESLLRLIPPMLEDPRQVIAVCGVTPAEAPAGLVSQYASLECLRGWLSCQAAFSGWNLLTPTAGSAMLIRRDSLLKAGGFRAGALELFLRLHADARAAEQPYSVVFVPNSGCRQVTPQSLAGLRAWVARDQRAVQRAFRVAGLPMEFRWGLWLVRFIRPLLETIAYVLTVVGLIAGWVSWPLALLVVLATAGLGILLSMAAVSLRELTEFEGSDPIRLARLFFAAIPENLGFRQLRNIWLLAPWSHWGTKRVDW